MSLGIVTFTAIYGIQNLPINHVSIEFVDLKTRKTIMFEHPDNKPIIIKPKRIEGRVIIGPSKYTNSQLKNIVPKRKVYIPFIYDCRNYALDVFDIAELPNTYNIKKSIKRGKLLK